MCRAGAVCPYAGCISFVRCVFSRLHGAIPALPGPFSKDCAFPLVRLPIASCLAHIARLLELTWQCKYRWKRKSSWSQPTLCQVILLGASPGAWARVCLRLARWHRMNCTHRHSLLAPLPAPASRLVAHHACVHDCSRAGREACASSRHGIMCWHRVMASCLLVLPSCFASRVAISTTSYAASFGVCGDGGGGAARYKVARCEVKVLMQQRHINPCCMVCVSGNKRAAARQGQRSGKHLCAGDAEIQFGGGGSRCHDHQGARW